MLCKAFLSWPQKGFMERFSFYGLSLRVINENCFTNNHHARQVFQQHDGLSFGQSTAIAFPF